MITPETVPPVIAALDTPTLIEAKKIADRLSDWFSPSQVGFKIPQWLDQVCQHEVLPSLVERGFTTILDTRLDDSIDKMQLAARAFLGLTVLPTALTMNPIKEYYNADAFSEIVNFVTDKSVAIIGFADQLQVDSRDEHYANLEVSRFESAARAGFAGFELHASTFELGDVHARFQQVRRNADQDMAVFASKFLHGTDDVAMQYDRIAAAYSAGANSVYLGASVVAAHEPVEVVERVLTIARRSAV